MIEIALTILWLLFVVVILYILMMRRISADEAFIFQNYDKVDVPYITAKVGSIPVNLIVDTGSGTSIISKNMLDILPHRECPRQIDMVALTDESVSGNMVTIAITVGNKEIEEDFAVYDTKDFGCFQANYGLTIHGLIGNEFLDSTNCRIDYKNHTLVIP